MSEEVRVTDQDDVRWIALHRPESRGGMTIDSNRLLIEAVTGAESAGARVVVLAGTDGNFCSGLDLKDAMRRGPIPPETLQSNLRDYFHGLIRAIRAAPMPIIAAIDGPAVGFGVDMALACDMRLCTARARFGEVFVKRGLIPDGGGTYSLPRLIGLGRALEMMLTGKEVGGEEAVSIGLANRLVDEEGFESAVWAFAGQLAKGPPMVHRMVKTMVYASAYGTLDDALEREAANQLRCLQSADFMEGLSAFLQKRDPVFKGK